MFTCLSDVLVVDAQSPWHQQRADVHWRDGRIVALATPGQLAIPDGARVLDGRGLCLSPGWVDLRAWVPDPGLEAYEDLDSAAAAAAAGGFTAVALLPNTQPVIQYKDLLYALQSRSSGQATRWLPLAAVTLETRGERLTDLHDLHWAGAVAFTDGLQPLANAGLLLRVLQYLQSFGGLLMDRPEDTSLTYHGVMHEGVESTRLGLPGMPALAETLRISRNLDLLRHLRAAPLDLPLPRLHFSTLSTAGGLQLIRAAKAEGLPVSADVAAHQLAFDDAALGDFDTNYKVNPPFRTAADQAALRQALQDGTLDAIVSDHRPYDPESKQVEFDLAAFGITGLETAFAVARMHAGLEVAALVEKLAHAPRRLLGLPPATLATDQPFEATLFDPERTWTYDPATKHSKAHNSPFLGQALRGKAVAVWREGAEWMDALR